MNLFKRSLIPAAALLLAALGQPAFAKLPAAELTPEAKAKAAEAAAKTAWTAKVDNFKLCQSQDQVAATYRASAAAAGKTAPPPVATPACADPGAFVYAPPAEAKPIEAAGAHSPAATAASPPSTSQPAATTNPTTK